MRTWPQRQSCHNPAQSPPRLGEPRPPWQALQRAPAPIASHRVLLYLCLAPAQQEFISGSARTQVEQWSVTCGHTAHVSTCPSPTVRRSVACTARIGSAAGTWVCSGGCGHCARAPTSWALLWRCTLWHHRARRLAGKQSVNQTAASRGAHFKVPTRRRRNTAPFLLRARLCGQCRAAHGYYIVVPCCSNDVLESD